MNSHFTYEFHNTLKKFSLFLVVKTISKLNMEHSVKLVMEILKLAVVVKVLQTTQRLDISRCCFAEDENKFTKVYSGRAQPFFCSLNLSFSNIAVAVSVVIFLNSLLSGNTTLFLTNPRSGSDRSFCQYILHDKNRKKVLSIRAQLNLLFGRGIMTTFSVCRAQPNTYIIEEIARRANMYHHPRSNLRRKDQTRKLYSLS